MKTWIIYAVLIVWAAQANAIEGRYKVEGQNPGQDQIYHGDAIIKKSGDAYSVVWQIGTSRQIGTGILTGSVLSVVFQSVGASGGGVASFEVVEGRIDAGRWAVLGGRTMGSERWTLVPNP